MPQILHTDTGLKQTHSALQGPRRFPLTSWQWELIGQVLLQVLEWKQGEMSVGGNGWLWRRAGRHMSLSVINLQLFRNGLRKSYFSFDFYIVTALQLSTISHTPHFYLGLIKVHLLHLWKKTILYFVLKRWIIFWPSKGVSSQIIKTWEGWNGTHFSSLVPDILGLTFLDI